ncbi:hypothetical protein NMY22_g10032 [Coprinellus aureogranulatus]|nr:hypothetical protein NMY22_g10032 [Coprinellus aureogranulatus]
MSRRDGRESTTKPSHQVLRTAFEARVHTLRPTAPAQPCYHPPSRRFRSLHSPPLVRRTEADEDADKGDDRQPKCLTRVQQAGREIFHSVLPGEAKPYQCSPYLPALFSPVQAPPHRRAPQGDRVYPALCPIYVNLVKPAFADAAPSHFGAGYSPLLQDPRGFGHLWVHRPRMPIAIPFTISCTMPSWIPNLSLPHPIGSQHVHRHPRSSSPRLDSDRWIPHISLAISLSFRKGQDPFFGDTSLCSASVTMWRSASITNLIFAGFPTCEIDPTRNPLLTPSQAYSIAGGIFLLVSGQYFYFFPECCGPHHAFPVKQILHLDQSGQVPMAIRVSSFGHSSDYHDRPDPKQSEEAVAASESKSASMPGGFCATGFSNINMLLIIGLLVDIVCQIYMFFLAWRLSKRLEHYSQMQGPVYGALDVTSNLSLPPSPTHPHTHPSSLTSSSIASGVQTLTAPPTVQLISPTPRTLIFPTSHNLTLSSSSPYSSPSASPFEGAGYDASGFEYHHHQHHHEGGFDHAFGGEQKHGGAFNDSFVPNDNNGFDYATNGFESGHYATFNTSHSSFHAYDASKASSTASLSLTIPEVPTVFPSYGGGQAQSPGGEQGSDSASLRSASPAGSVHSQDRHKRRKSTSSARDKSAERRPKKGDADYVKRPENAFILFRRAACEERSLRSPPSPPSLPSLVSFTNERTTRTDARPPSPPSPVLALISSLALSLFLLFLSFTSPFLLDSLRSSPIPRQAQEAQAALAGGAPAKKQRQADLSKMISEKWRNLSGEEKAVWEEKAKEAKAEHLRNHPDYVYRPERKSKRSTSSSTTSPSSSTSTSQPARKPSLSRRRASEDSNSGVEQHLSVFVPMNPSTSSSFSSASLSSTSPLSSLTSPSPSSNETGGTGPHRHRSGRSSSAPRPYHRIDVPRVSHGEFNLGGGRQGSEPTSPSLVPLINEHSRMGAGGWDYVPPSGAGRDGYPSMSMVQSLFTHNTNTTQHARKSSAPSPLQQIALQHQSTTTTTTSSVSSSVPSPLSLISPPSSSSVHSTSAQDINGGSDSGSSSESGSPFTPSSVPSHAFMMPSYETLLEPPRESTYDGCDSSSSSLPHSSSSLHHHHHHSASLPSSHLHGHADFSSSIGMGMGLGGGLGGGGSLDNMGMGMGMDMEGMLMTGTGVSGGGAHQDAYGTEGPFGGWDWPVGEGTLDNNWDVNSIPLASLSPSSLSPNVNPMDGMTTQANGMDGMSGGPGGVTSPTQALAAQFGSLGMGSQGKGIGAFEENVYEGMGALGGGMEYGSDPTLIGVNGYDDILAGGAFA